jgi:hypothetical protein
MNRILSLAAVGAALLMPLATDACGTTADRQGPAGTQPDGYQDMTKVVVYRAPDTVPNIAVGCIGGYGFMTTLKASGSDTNSGGSAPSLLRFPEYDKTCAS